MIRFLSQLAHAVTHANDSLQSKIHRANQQIAKAALQSFANFGGVKCSSGKFKSKCVDFSLPSGSCESLWEKGPATGVHPAFASYPKAIEGMLTELNRYPRLKESFDEILKDGSLEIVFENNPAGASWQFHQRRMIVDPELCADDLLESILFELGNARQSKLFIELSAKTEDGEVSCDDYIREMERIEWHSVRWRSAVIDEAIIYGALGEYALERPQSFPGSFEAHYLSQQLLGHTKPYVRQYARLSGEESFSYQGTLPEGLTKREKKSVKKLLPEIWQASRCKGKVKKLAKRKLKHCMSQVSEQALHGSESEKASAQRLRECYLQVFPKELNFICSSL